MSLSFLPNDLKSAIDNLNYNFISEIRIRRGQPVLIEYMGEYKYLNALGVTESERGLITVNEINSIIHSATGGCIYNFTEQMKHGFITVEHGVRIGIAGEYVTQNGEVQAIKSVTSLNIRIPHDIENCADFLLKRLYFNGLHSTMLYSKPGLGKTTMLRNLAKRLSAEKKVNVLVFDERNEIAAMDGYGNGFDMGERVDVVRCHNKKSAIASAIRAMKPDLIVTDELYGNEDIEAVNYAANCGILVIASSHICNKEILKSMPFEFFVELTGIGKQPVIYDKNFDIVGGDRAVYDDRNFSVVE
ncbi:MAG: hypothetical protein K2G96_05680 [Clostridia bacterium]|nr:hypothetical protein [Clostridia bacterium]